MLEIPEYTTCMMRARTEALAAVALNNHLHPENRIDPDCFGIGFYTLSDGTPVMGLLSIEKTDALKVHAGYITGLTESLEVV